MAEEKCEILQAEIDAANTKLEELQIDYNYLKAELEGGGANIPQANSVQMKQLEQQNERMREALVKMRDITATCTEEKNAAVEEVEKLREEMAALLKLCEKMKKDAEAAEEQVAVYKEQVDAALGSEAMIEKLTEKNLDMEEKIRSLEETIEDLEALRAMDDEILETEKDAERELREQLDMSYGKINELQAQIKTYDQQAEDYEKIVIKFRQRVCDLNEEIQEQKDQILRLEQQLKEIEEGEVVPGIQTSGMVVANRVFADIVESEVMRLELQYYKQHVKYLQAFLPDNFTKAGGDNDAVILNVMFPRLSQKALLLARLLNDKYPSVPGGIRREHITKSHKAEQWAHIAKFTYFLTAFSVVVGKFWSVIQCCSVERLSRLSQLQTEMALHERMIDQFIDLLKMSRIDENTSTANIEKGIAYFENVFAVYMAGESFPVNETISAVISQVLNGFIWLKINCQRLNFFVLPDQEDSEMKQFTECLDTAIADCEQLAVRSRNRIPSERNISFNADVEESIRTLLSNLQEVAQILHNLCSLASTQLSMLPDIEGLEVGRLEEMLQGAVEKEKGHRDGRKAKEYLRSCSVEKRRPSSSQSAVALSKAGSKNVNCA
ncbi:hypothetical protein AB6A40_005342 [Gnathostoma spinigerum]|uniref:Dynein associated protein domain-containing protein n=1 Tax=Gnathostoma spinigerum TaxID=75299 RepID=A0ABD6EFB2_9BILA